MVDEETKKPDDRQLEGYTDRAELGAKVRAVIDAIAEVVRPGETTRAHVLQVLAHVIAGALDGKSPGFLSAYFARIRDMKAELTPATGEPAWSTDNLQEHLDIELAQVVEDARRRASMDGVTFTGTVSGLLLRTGLALAAKHGAPRSVVEVQLSHLIQETWTGGGTGMNRAQRRADAATKRRQGSS